jgi:hypothetical protein
LLYPGAAVNSVFRPIATIQQDLTNAQNARTAILTGAQSGSLNSGSGSTSFTAADLKTLNDLIKDLVEELGDAQDEQNYGTTNLTTTIFRRMI